MPTVGGMAFTDQLQLVRDASFRDRVTMAAVYAATQIAGEARTDGHDSYFNKREALATQVLNAPTGIAERFTWAVASNPGIGPNPSDNDIQFTVNSMWDDMAGVTEPETP